MLRLAVLAGVLGLALPAAAQSDAVRPDRIVVAEINGHAIRPFLEPARIAGLVDAAFDDAARREGKRPRFEQSWIARFPQGYHLTVDAQFDDGNDFLLSLPLEEVEYGEKRLLVLAGVADA